MCRRCSPICGLFGPVCELPWPGRRLAAGRGWLTLQQGDCALAQSPQGEVYSLFCIFKTLDPIFCWAPLGEGSQSRLGVGIVMSDDELWPRSVMLSKREVSSAVRAHRPLRSDPPCRSTLVHCLFLALVRTTHSLVIGLSSLTKRPWPLRRWRC